MLNVIQLSIINFTFHLSIGQIWRNRLVHHLPALLRNYRGSRLKSRRSSSSWRRVTDKRWSVSELTTSSRPQRLRSDTSLSSSCCRSDCRTSQALRPTSGDVTVKTQTLLCTAHSPYTEIDKGTYFSKINVTISEFRTRDL